MITVALDVPFVLSVFFSPRGGLNSRSLLLQLIRGRASASRLREPRLNGAEAGAGSREESPSAGWEKLTRGEGDALLASLHFTDKNLCESDYGE